MGVQSISISIAVPSAQFISRKNATYMIGRLSTFHNVFTRASFQLIALQQYGTWQEQHQPYQEPTDKVRPFYICTVQGSFQPCNNILYRHMCMQCYTENACHEFDTSNGCSSSSNSPLFSCADLTLPCSKPTAYCAASWRPMSLIMGITE